MNKATYELVEADPKHTIVKLKGRLDMMGLGDFELKLTFDTTSRRLPTIVDMAEVTYIGSLGIGTLLMIAKSLQQHKAPLVLEAVAPPILQALRQARISDIFVLASDRAHSLQLIARK